METDYSSLRIYPSFNLKTDKKEKTSDKTWKTIRKRRKKK